jgi:Leucine-rich repeat (LRR) protein
MLIVAMPDVLPPPQIRDLTPLTPLTRLRRLEVHTNEVDDIEPLAALPKLQALNVSHNRLADFATLLKALARFPALLSLRISGP